MQDAAQHWANQCSISYQTFGDSRDETIGQNIYPVKEDSADAGLAVRLWESFKEGHKSGTFECKEEQDCYPYLQVCLNGFQGLFRFKSMEVSNGRS